MAFETDSNRTQPLWQRHPTARLTASRATSEAPSLLMHPRGGGGGGTRGTRGNHAGAHNAHVHQVRRRSDWAPRTRQRGEAGGGRPGQHAEGWSNGASRTQKRGETWSGRPGREGEWAAKTVQRPPQQPAQPPVRQLLGPATAATTPQKEHRPQRPTERSDPTQHAKGRTGDKETTTRRNVTPGAEPQAHMAYGRRGLGVAQQQGHSEGDCEWTATKHAPKRTK